MKSLTGVALAALLLSACGGDAPASNRAAKNSLIGASDALSKADGAGTSKSVKPQMAAGEDPFPMAAYSAFPFDLQMLLRRADQEAEACERDGGGAVRPSQVCELLLKDLGDLREDGWCPKPPRLGSSAYQRWRPCEPDDSEGYPTGIGDMIRYADIKDSSCRIDRGKDPDVCRERDELIQDLRQMGWCRVNDDPEAEDRWSRCPPGV